MKFTWRRDKASSKQSKHNVMNKEPETEIGETEAEILPEYNFSNGTRGKYAARHKVSSNIVVLDEDVAQAFPIAEAVNQALRMLVQIAQQNVHKHAG